MQPRQEGDTPLLQPFLSQQRRQETVLAGPEMDCYLRQILWGLFWWNPGGEARTVLPSRSHHENCVWLEVRILILVPGAQ
jgi:hypothetical protein